METAPAEIEEQPLKHQDGSGAAEDDEGLAAHQAERHAGERCAHEALQHALRTPRGSIQRRGFGGGGAEGGKLTAERFESSGRPACFP